MNFDTREFCKSNEIVSFSFNLVFNNTTGKKEPKNQPLWKNNKLTKENFKKTYKSDHNSFAILTGAINKIIVVDCDVKKADGAFPQHILDELNNTCKSIVKTPNGFHYYYSIEKNHKKGTDVCWNGEHIPCLDVLADGALIYAPPSSYSRGDELVSYQWLEGNLSTLVELPDSIYKSLTKKKIDKTVAVDIRSVLDKISIERLDNYTSWLNIGMILKARGDPVELWDEYSSKSTQYKKGVCAEKWRTFPNENSLTIATLYNYIKEDSIDDFYTLQKNKVSFKTILADVTHARYAELFHCHYNDNYIYNNDIGWYALQDDNTWVLYTKGAPPMKTKIRNFFIDFIDQVSEQLDSSDEDDMYRKIFVKAKNSVSTNGFLESIISILQELFYKTYDFIQIFDKNPNLLAFKDKVFDSNILEFRDILPSDYITTTIKRKAPSLDQEFSPELKTFFYSIFEDEEKTQSLLRVLAYSLFGNRKHQELYMLTGAGGNGKGLLINMMLYTLGDYCRNLPSTYITKPSDGKDGALPSLAASRNARILYTSELESRDVLQVGFLKNVSGNDILTVRKLHSDSFSFLPQFNMFVLCNSSKMSKVEPATKRRLRVYNFPFQFREVVQQQNDRLINKELDAYTKTDACADNLLSVLLQIYIKEVHDKNSLNHSKSVMDDTETYLKENNPVAGWLSENYILHSDETISSADLLKHFNETNNKLRGSDFIQYIQTFGFDGINNTHTKGKDYNFKRIEKQD